MVFDVNYLQTLRDCCPDEVTFDRLQQLLVDPGFTEFLLARRAAIASSGLSGVEREVSSESEQLAQQNAALVQQVAVYAAQLQQQTAELETLRRWQGVVFHIVEHDLRTFVMGSIMVLKNLLQQAGETLTVSRARVERMAQGSDRQLELINNLLETHSTEMAGMPLEPEVISFHEVAEATASSLEPFLVTNQAHLTQQIHSDLPDVLADGQQIQRVIQHLVTVAVKHNPPGLNLILEATVEADMLYCTLQDDGTLWEPTECDRFFDLRVQAPRACCSTSLGVQLHLCQQIIAIHGGQIGMISLPQQGNTYWFTLPLASTSQPANSLVHLATHCSHLNASSTRS